jgi:hypothetical protein
VRLGRTPLTRLWDGLAWLLGPRLPLPPTGDELTVCRRCGAPFVVPVRWSEHEGGWAMHLRCGECGGRRDVLLSDAEAEQFGAALDRGVAELALLADALGDRLPTHLTPRSTTRQEPR